MCKTRPCERPHSRDDHRTVYYTQICIKHPAHTTQFPVGCTVQLQLIFKGRVYMQHNQKRSEAFTPRHLLYMLLFYHSPVNVAPSTNIPGFLSNLKQMQIVCFALRITKSYSDIPLEYGTKTDMPSYMHTPLPFNKHKNLHAILDLHPLTIKHKNIHAILDSHPLTIKHKNLRAILHSGLTNVYKSVGAIFA